MSEQRWYYHDGRNPVGPLPVNDLQQLALSGEIDGFTLVASDGENTWAPYDSRSDEITKAAAQNKAAGFSTIADSIGSATGLGKLEGFSFKHLFSQVFTKHTTEEMDEVFGGGTTASTPPLQQINTAWPAPWAFVRLLALSVIGTVVLYWAIGEFQNALLIPAWLLIGCFGIPISVLVFFIETNILRNVPIYRVLSLLLVGGVIGLIASLILFEVTGLAESWLGAMSAGIIEETGKLFAVIVVTKHWKDHHWTLNGLLFGAAVGAGFAAFESAGYVFTLLIQDIYTGESMAEETLKLRALLSPFTHTIWTAAAAGALWRFKSNAPKGTNPLTDPRFLRVFFTIVALHMLWNSPLSLPLLDGELAWLGLRVILGVVGWAIIILLVQSGISQIREHKMIR